MEEFLKTVARHYKRKSEEEARISQEPASLPLSRQLFCFPNRRSALFFSRHLQEAFGGACCLPSFITINELFGRFSNRQIADRTTLQFRLFEVYDKLSLRSVKETFDQFVFWGDLILADYEDVDKYLVDADRLFANVRDLKEIDARFAGFSEEQIQVIRSFWKSFRGNEGAERDEKYEIFGQTWAILADLYHQFRSSLAKENLAYEGMMEREVVEKLYEQEQNGEDPFAGLDYDKVVFVGLTAVSEVDRRLMSLLKLHGKAEFCWDYADPRIHDQESKATSAAYFTRRNLSDFPNEISDEELARGIVSEEDRDVKLYSVSSSVGQTLKAKDILLEWMKADGKDFDALRTAVVLPDEKLLLPMLYAVPEQLSNFNVTMGYSLRSTPVSAFMHLLAELQGAWKEEGKTFYYQQVLPVLSHSYMLGMQPVAARVLSKKIAKDNIYQISESLFAEHTFLRTVFRHVSSASDTLHYLMEVLDLLMARAARDIDADEEEGFDNEPQQLEMNFEAAEKPQQPRIFAKTDYEFLYHYRKTVENLDKEIQRHSITFSSKTLFLLLDKLIAGVSVPFSGEPLNGLQVMGVLETRSLDFDNVVILSMNEGVFPAKPTQNTFVPMSLRDAFGMPTQRHRDSVFAYHFYRLIGRAKRLVMIYDSRTEGMQSGEESRYVKQLKYLMGHEKLEAESVTDPILVEEPSGFAVYKTPEVMAQLEQCVAGKGKLRLSATALKHYINCPLQFYLSFVRNLKEDDEVSEGVDNASFGTILHRVMELLYEGCIGKSVESSMLDKYIKNKKEIRQAISQAYKEVLNITEPTGYVKIISTIIEGYIIETLKHDRSLCPFTYLGSEKKHTLVFPLTSEMGINIKGVYDRLDAPLTEKGKWRIVDYKTGNAKKGDKLYFASVDDLFEADGKGSDEAFQVMLYCLMLRYATPDDLQKMGLPPLTSSLVPHLYFVNQFNSHNQQVKTSLSKGTRSNSEEVTDFEPYQQEMEDRLRAMLLEIFNQEIPFRQCEDVKKCQYCPFKPLCKRFTN